MTYDDGASPHHKGVTMATKDRYDLLLVCEDPTRRIAPRGGEALLRAIAVQRIVTPVSEAIADEWVEVYCSAGPSAHEAFVRGAWSEEEAIFEEAVFRFGSKAVPIPFGLEDTDVTFFIELRGCLFEDVLGKLKTQFKDILRTRPRVLARPRQDPPPHREVPEDELPKDRRKRRQTTAAQAGTRVEEW